MIENPMIDIIDVNTYYGTNHALKNINIKIPRNAITAFIGPSGCGKTTLLRSLNRMNDFIDSFKLEGRIIVDSEDIYNYKSQVDLIHLRRKVGLVFQSPNPFPSSIYKNISMPISEGRSSISHVEINDKVKEFLQKAHIYDEVKDKLRTPAHSLSGGQQQRLCIARALSISPEIILFDEPCSALDPISTMKIEELLDELKQRYTIVIVTHNLEQARRIADYTAFFYQGEILEYGESSELFTSPKHHLTEAYISGRF